MISQFEEAIGHGRGADGGPSEPWHHGGEIVASIEAILELSEISGDVLLTDGAIGSGQGGLDVAERGVDPFEGRRQRGLATGAGSDRLVSASGVGDTPKAGEAVTDDGAARMD